MAEMLLAWRLFLFSSISSSDNTSQGLVIKGNSDVEIFSVDDCCFTDCSDDEL